MPTFCNCKATFDYAAANPDELDLKIGDIIVDVDISVEGGWWEGVHPSGKRGWFPDNFVEKMAESKKAPPPAKPPAPAAPAAAPASTGGGGGGGKKLCKCTFEYVAANPDELTMKVGDIITIIKQEEEGWWEGSLNGKSGAFPNNFVEEIAGTAPAAEDDQVKPHKVEKVGFGNIFAGGGVPQLRKTGTFSSGSKPDFLAKGKAGAGAVDPTKLDLVKVEFDYNAENADELTLKKGQFVKVTKREDGGWWTGELIGSDTFGVFPDNFVVPASDSEKREQAAMMGPGPAAAPPPAAEPAPPRPNVAKPKAESALPPPAKAKAPPPATKKPPPVSMKKKPPAVSMKKPAAKKPPPAAEPKAVAAPAPVVSAPAPAASASAPDPAVARAADAAKKAADSAKKSADEALAMIRAMQADIEAVRKENATMKKHIKVLISDLDEERGERAKMRVEIDRLKKLSEI